MTKTLTEQWREGKLESGEKYVKLRDGRIFIEYFNGFEFRCLYNSDIQEILAPVPSYEKVKEMSQKNAELVSKTDELVQKIHILNEQNTKQYNELCEEIKKNNILEKKLEIATKALKEINKNYRFTVAQDVVYKALKEMEGVK